MKLSKNVLVGSLASAGMILGLVAPATTAFAATSSFTEDSNGNVVKNTTGQSGVLDKTYVAIAGNDKDGADPAGVTGTATADSNVNLRVVNGLLVLKAVPNFGFGTVASGAQTASLEPNAATSGSAEDGNDEGNLSVVDSRAADTNGMGKGFQLSATLNGFVDSEGNAGAGDGFTMDLAAKKLINDQEASIGGTNVSALTTEGATLKKGVASDIISLAAGSYTTGAVNAVFDKSSDATLNLGGAATAKENINSYKGTITWTLNAAPKA